MFRLSTVASIATVIIACSLIPSSSSAPTIYRRTVSRDVEFDKLARDLDHLVERDMDSMLLIHAHEILFKITMNEGAEEACRHLGGTPIGKNQHAICTLNPEPEIYRHTLIRADGKSYGSQRYFPLASIASKRVRHEKSRGGMSVTAEEDCRRKGGTPESVPEGATCSMDPTPERRTVQVVETAFTVGNEHGRRGDELEKLD